MQRGVSCGENDSPTEHTENQVHDKKCAEHHQGYKVHKLPGVAHGVMNLKGTGGRLGFSAIFGLVFLNRAYYCTIEIY